MEPENTRNEALVFLPHEVVAVHLRRSGLQTLVIHCQFGGRPLITAMLTELLKYMGAWSLREVSLQA